MFYVVHVDEWFQTIPDNWVNKTNKTIYWPTEKNAMLTMWIKKKYHTNRIGRYTITFVCLDHSVSKNKSFTNQSPVISAFFYGFFINSLFL